MRAITLVATVLMGCGGAPFTMADAVTSALETSDTAPEASAPDANTVTVDGGAGLLDGVGGEMETTMDTTEASHQDRSPVRDAAPDVGHDACDTILPYTPILPFCPATCGTCGPQNAPQTFWEVTPGWCQGVPTPAACQACGEYTCACIMANLTPGLLGGANSRSCPSSGATPTCNDTTGVPTMVCP